MEGSGAPAFHIPAEEKYGQAIPIRWGQECMEFEHQLPLRDLRDIPFSSPRERRVHCATQGTTHVLVSGAVLQGAFHSTTGPIQQRLYNMV